MEVIEIENIPKTALDIFRILPEGTLCEVIDNILYMSPSPLYDHQHLVGVFFKKMSAFVDSHNIGEVMVSPFDVYLEDLQSAVQPDVLYLSNENRDILKKDGRIHGAPDIIVEILSGDTKRDKITKKNLYERAGVKEYFIANPRNRKVQCFVLKEGGYELSYEAEGKFKSVLLGYSFDF